jgi:nucleotide-binding universal stress UspA family protein
MKPGGVVHLCHVHERALPSPAYAYADETGALSPAGRADLESRLRALVPAWARDLGIEARVTVIDGGQAASEITRAALRLDADAIALASHGRSGVKRALLGSVAEEVLRHAKSPVYVVPSHSSR